MENRQSQLRRWSTTLTKPLNEKKLTKQGKKVKKRKQTTDITLHRQQPDVITTVYTRVQIEKCIPFFTPKITI
jgi:hypothetical protein